MNLVSKHRLVSCSTQTQTQTQTQSVKDIKIKKKNRIPSLKNIKLKLDQLPYFNIPNNNRIPSHLKGKKVLKKKKLLDIYNNLYNNKNAFSQGKKENEKNNSKNNKHKKGAIALSFGGTESFNKIILSELNSNNKKNNFRIFKKINNKILNILNNNDDDKYPLLNRPVYELPLYNVSKILKNNNNNIKRIVYRNNDDEKIKQNNVYEDININNNYYINCKEEFPLIMQTSNNFDSTDIKKDNEIILKDLFRKNCYNKKKTNKKLIKIHCFNKSIFNDKKIYNCATQENNKPFNENDLIKSKIGKKLNTDINCIKVKVKVKKLSNYNHNRTTDNII